MTRFRELRKKANLTQEELIAKFNVQYGKKYTAAAISQFEHGKRIPTTESLKDFAEFFGVSIDYLLGRSPAPATDSSSALTADDIGHPLTPAERHHLSLYRSLDDKDRATVDDMTAMYADRARDDEVKSFGSTTSESKQA